MCDTMCCRDLDLPPVVFFAVLFYRFADSNDTACRSQSSEAMCFRSRLLALLHNCRLRDARQAHETPSRPLRHSSTATCCSFERWQIKDLVRGNCSLCDAIKDPWGNQSPREATKSPQRAIKVLERQSKSSRGSQSPLEAVKVLERHSKTPRGNQSPREAVKVL